MTVESFFSLGLYFVVMLLIGLYSYRKSSRSLSGYMLGNRSLSPSVTALSAGASDMSGWMLMGVPGAMYLSGLNSIWIIFGLVIGAYLNYLFVAPRLRTFTEFSNDSITLPDYLENRFEDKTKVLRFISSVVIIIFFTLYTSSGLVAGGKLFLTSFGTSYEMGVYVTAAIVVLYTLLGGFLAVSLTDFVQGCLMFIALILVPVVVFIEIGSVSEAERLIREVSFERLDIFHDMTIVGIISAMSWGVGYFGQPHILVRFMAVRHVKDLKLTKWIGMSWMLVSLLGAILTGLLGIAYVQKMQLSLADPEAIFIFFSQLLFNPLIAGFLLAAILAAIMSTISSQLLVTSSSLTRDVYQMWFHKKASDKELLMIGRLSVFTVALCAIYLSYNPNNSVLGLVSNAWAGFGAAFGPVIILSLFWKSMTKWGALAGIITGSITVLFWVFAPLTINGSSLSSLMYEMVPGFTLASLAVIVVSLLTKIKPSGAQKDTVSELFTHLKTEHYRQLNGPGKV